MLEGAPRLALTTAFCLAALSSPQPAAAQKARITNLSDVNFGLIANLQTDARRSQNVCVFSQSTGSLYSITATGSGSGSSFALTDGTNSLAYEVEWSDQSGQTSGTSLVPAVAATGRVSAATQQTCSNGPATSASLIVILRSSSLTQARAGNYSGSLTLVVAAE
ncbi:hypothetical protein [Sphingomonas sp.]|uniref:hypothetical protein n=1 Tax=Sphingomonas sp. TaxID=28214 RepID=UPI0025D5BCF0|nr:hypothetical protein [Sphingomonas sp.]